MTQPQLTQEQIDNATEIKCEQCEGLLFDQTCALRKLSAIDPTNTSGQPQLIPMGMFVCRTCNAPLTEIE